MPKAKMTKTQRATAVRGAQYEYTVVFEPAEDGGYVVTVPAPPGLRTEGDTFEEAQAMAADAIRCYIEGCILDGEEVPVERGYAITQRIPVQVSPANVHARELDLREAEDADIFDRAREAAVVVLTNDEDFVELVRSAGSSGAC